ncbi:MAG: hypothetical protein J1E06_07035 [Acutalibacter sp.]|nr:hypothetical protein [Acutalibacter sp.]
MKETASSPDWVFDTDTIPGDYVCINFDLNQQSVTNAQGEELHWSQGKNSINDFPPEGTMQFYGYLPSLGTADIWVPYSNSFTVQTGTPMEVRTKFSAEFNRDNFWVSDMRVSGHLEGTVTLSDDNTMEVNGKHSKISASFCVHKKEGIANSEEYLYELSGGAGENTKIRLEGDEIIAEGLTEKYSVTKYEYVYEDGSDHGISREVWTKDYPADSGDS